MLNIDQIGESIRQWIETVTSLQCIFADENGPRPTDPYLSIKVKDTDSLGEGETSSTPLPDYSIDIEHSNIHELKASINAYRGSAFQELTKLVSSLDHFSTLDYFTAADIGIGRVGSPVDIPDVVNKNNEARAQIDLFFHVRSLSTENIEGIKQVEITNEIDGTTTIIKHPDLP